MQFTYYFLKNYSKSCMIGKKMIFLPICQSTNTELARLASQEALLEGTTLYTHAQTAGKGQRGNSWESEPSQNLTFSYLVYPETLLVGEMFLLSMATALGVHEFVAREVGEAKVRIKYPNDILVGTQKIAGILIENSLKGENIEKSIIGIGLNINQTQFANPRATYTPETCLPRLLKDLDKWYKMLKEKKYTEIKANFLAKSFQFNELCTYYTKDREIYGKIIDIDTAGQLHLETNAGIECYFFKEIAFFPLQM
jgi:BirA family transcriptional regulator, biotin operon repressor / biotin---[acetyl-CoA-carboxylase] ligase